MNTRKEQIIEILKNNIDFAYDNYGKVVNSNDLETIADAILALPIEVSGDEEIKKQYPVTYSYQEDTESWKNRLKQKGAKWMRDEIIKRNRP